jgi:hypothetical protein
MPDASEYLLWRHTLPDGEVTTVYAVRHPRVVFDAEDDREGFSAGAGQFDSDITEGRYPRAALGVSGEWLTAVACDGRRSRVDGVLSMLELAEVMVELGAESWAFASPRRPNGVLELIRRGPLWERQTSRRTYASVADAIAARGPRS